MALNYKKAKILGVIFTLLITASVLILPASAQHNDYLPIQIDGSFEDWSDKPMTRLHYDWQIPYYHAGSLFRDEEYVYLYIKMAEQGYMDFNGYNYLFKVDGVDHYVVVVPQNGAKKTEGLNSYVVRSQNNYTLIDGAVAAVMVTKGESDVCELRIPLSYFSQNPDAIGSISFYSSNLGPQTITAVGTPTLPYLVAGLGLVLAAAGIYRRKKKASQDKAYT